MDVYHTLWQILYKTLETKEYWDTDELSKLMQRLESDELKNHITDD